MVVLTGCVLSALMRKQILSILVPSTSLEVITVSKSLGVSPFTMEYMSSIQGVFNALVSALTILFACPLVNTCRKCWYNRNSNEDC